MQAQILLQSSELGVYSTWEGEAAATTREQLFYESRREYGKVKRRTVKGWVFYKNAQYEDGGRYIQEAIVEIVDETQGDSLDTL